MPGVGEDRVDRLETAADRRVRVALPEEGEDLLAALVEKGGGKRERRIVGGLEPELDDDPRRAAGVVQLVEPEPDVPRRARASVEPAVDPRAQAPLERRVSGVRRQGRVVGMERREEPLRCGVSPSGRATADRAERPARELVERAAVEVVDERVGIPVERLRADRRRGVRDRVELVPHGLVERRPPERVPAAVARLEVRVDEPFGERPAGALEDGERHLGAAAEQMTVGLDVEELGELQAPRGRSRADVREVGGDRSPEGEPVGGQTSVGVAQERERARVVLPEELEGRRGALRGGVGRFAHEPVSIGATADAGLG